MAARMAVGLVVWSNSGRCNFILLRPHTLTHEQTHIHRNNHGCATYLRDPFTHLTGLNSFYSSVIVTAHEK